MRANLIAALVMLSLGACGNFDGGAADDAFPVPVSGPELAPIAANRFTFVAGQDVVGQIQIVRARYADTFVDFARAYGLGYDDLVAANPGVDPWLPGEGTAVVLPTRYVLPLAPRQGIVLNVAAKRLFWYPPVVDGEPPVVETFPVGIGRTGWSTPTGTTTVVAKARDPIWYVPRSVREEHRAAGDPLPRQVPPGPDNPLGRHVLGLGIDGYLIHGTNKPAGVGMRVSHGCVRLFPEDIAHVYDRVPVGTPVRIVNQPVLFGWDGNELYLEAHAPLVEDERPWAEMLLPMARSSLVDADGRRPVLDAARLHRIAGDELGYPLPVYLRRMADAFDARDVRYVVNILPDDVSAGRTGMPAVD